LQQLKRPDEALALLKEYGEKFPKSIHQPRIVAARAQLKLDKGDKVGALEDYTTLEKNAAVWGEEAQREGLLGKVKLFISDRKFGDAVALLKPVFDRTKPEDKESFASYGLILGDCLKESGKLDEALALWRRLSWTPLATSDQAAAHLRQAQALAETKKTADTIAAFDLVCLALVVGGDGIDVENSKKLLRELAKRIESDPAVSDADKKEYRSYPGQF